MDKSAGSKVESWTAEDEAAMQALLARRQRVSTAMVGDVRSGNMSDASKRRCFSEDEASYEEWLLTEEAKEATKSDEPKKEFILPKGIEFIEKWGTTLITMDAYKKEKLTFAKAVTKSEHDEKMKKYLNFILAKFGEQACEEPTTQAVDLAMYLQARNYQPKKGYERTFAS